MDRYEEIRKKNEKKMKLREFFLTVVAYAYVVLVFATVIGIIVALGLAIFLG